MVHWVFFFFFQNMGVVSVGKVCSLMTWRQYGGTPPRGPFGFSQGFYPEFLQEILRILIHIFFQDSSSSFMWNSQGVLDDSAGFFQQFLLRFRLWFLQEQLQEVFQEVLPRFFQRIFLRFLYQYLLRLLQEFLDSFILQEFFWNVFRSFFMTSSRYSWEFQQFCPRFLSGILQA